MCTTQLHTPHRLCRLCKLHNTMQVPSDLPASEQSQQQNTLERGMQQALQKQARRSNMRRVQGHTQPLIHVSPCGHTLSSLHMQTYADTCPALDARIQPNKDFHTCSVVNTCRHMHTHTLSQPPILAAICRQMLSPQYMQAHVHTFLAPNTSQ